MKKKRDFEPKWIVVFAFFIAGILFGGLSILILFFQNGSFFGFKKIHPANSSYQFINPLLAVDTTAPNDLFENKTLESKIMAVLPKKQDNENTVIGLYFRDLESGRWVGINENVKFPTGKLLKVPLMIAYLSQAELDPNILDQQLPYNTNISSNFRPHEKKQYTTNELLEIMIKDDNDTIANVLFDNLNKHILDNVYTDLGIPFSEDRDSEDFISPRLYSFFFRVLYNATYLNRENSERALQILSQTEKQKGFVANLPANIQAAHKYRFHLNQTSELSTGQVYDCGIVYYPAHPYILCIMARGKNPDTMENLYREISKIIYDDMTSRYK